MLSSKSLTPLLYIDPFSFEDKLVLASKWGIPAWTSPTDNKGMKVTFHLVDRIKWQGGVPLTSQEIKFGIEYIKTNQVPRFESITSLVDSVRAPDKLTVEIYLNDAGYRHLYDLAWLTFMPRHIWQDVADYKSFMP